MTIRNYITQSGYRYAILLELIFPRVLAGVVVMLSGLGFLAFLLAASFALPDKQNAFRYLAGAQIFLGLFLLLFLYWRFLKFYQNTHSMSSDVLNEARLNGRYGKGLNFFSCMLLAATCKHEYLFLRVFYKYLLQDGHFKWMLERLNVNAKVFASIIVKNYTKSDALTLEAMLKIAAEKATASNHPDIRMADVLIAVYMLDEKLQKIFFDFKLEKSDIEEVFYWQRRLEESRELKGGFFDPKNLLNVKGIGKNWSVGYTVHLDSYARDVTKEVKIRKAPAHLFGRGREIELLERMLVRGAGSCNAVLVGYPGVGRHSIIYALASKMNFGQSLGPLRYMRLVEIESGSILAGAANLNEVQGRIQLIFGEAYRAENVILVIKDIDAFLDQNLEAGRVNATEALLPFLESRLHMIGITTPHGYQTTIGKNPQLSRLFGKLEVGEMSEHSTLLVLQDAAPAMEKRYGIYFSNSALSEIVRLGGKLIKDFPNPEKSLKILEDTAVHVAGQRGIRVVTKEHVQRVIAARTKIPVEKVAGVEKELLLNLEQILHEKIIGQDEAVAELANTLRRARSGIRSEKKPIGSFLFLGPTGVGKTETSKALAAVYFGSEKNIIRFDMSEFQEVHSINRLIGDADRNEGGLLTESIIANPFSLVLFDEIEKAHPKILDLFLQVFDEGRATDAFGRTVDFTNAMFIATSNAGAEFIRQAVKANKNLVDIREGLLDELQRQGIFRPEFLNRFDAILIFRPLTGEEMFKVAYLLLGELNSRLAENEIQIKITAELASAVVANAYHPEFGARPLRRFIQERIENYLAKKLLSGEIQRGQTVEIPVGILKA